MTQDLLNELMRQADTLTPDEQLRLAAHLVGLKQKSRVNQGIIDTR